MKPKRETVDERSARLLEELRKLDPDPGREPRIVAPPERYRVLGSRGRRRRAR